MPVAMVDFRVTHTAQEGENGREMEWMAWPSRECTKNTVALDFGERRTDK
jgi:hypothetical protein